MVIYVFLRGQCKAGECIPYCESHDMISCACDQGKKTYFIPKFANRRNVFQHSF